MCCLKSLAEQGYVPVDGKSSGASTGTGQKLSVVLAVDGMTCADCASRLEQRLLAQPAVAAASVNRSAFVSGSCTLLARVSDG